MKSKGRRTIISKRQTNSSHSLEKDERASQEEPNGTNQLPKVTV